MQLSFLNIALLPELLGKYYTKQPVLKNTITAVLIMMKHPWIVLVYPPMNVGVTKGEIVKKTI